MEELEIQSERQDRKPNLEKQLCSNPEGSGHFALLQFWSLGYAAFLARLCRYVHSNQKQDRAGN